MLFLHGFPTSSRDRRKVAPRFSDRRAIYIDLLGFGNSDEPNVRHSYVLQADLTLALLNTLGVKSASIVAHDYSVTLAQELLHRQSLGRSLGTSIDRVVFLNGGVYGRFHRQQRFHRLLLTPVVGAFVARRIRPKALKRGFNAIAGRPGAWSDADAQEH